MDNQQYLRDAVNAFRQRYGTPRVWFSRQLGIHPSHFNYWLNAERILSQKRIEKLEAILQQATS